MGVAKVQLNMKPSEVINLWSITVIRPQHAAVIGDCVFTPKSETLLSWLTRAARWAWPLGWGMDLCESEPVSGVRHWQDNHIRVDAVTETYLPTVMWKFPATLLTNRCPWILQAFSEAELSSLRREGAGEEGSCYIVWTTGELFVFNMLSYHLRSDTGSNIEFWFYLWTLT